MKTRTKQGHTAGPWTIQDNTETGGQLRVDSETHGAVASCGVGNFVDEESRANAALIAAAPELLEASKQALEWLQSQDYWTQMRNADWHNALKKAIAKAEGRA